MPNDSLGSSSSSGTDGLVAKRDSSRANMATAQPLDLSTHYTSVQFKQWVKACNVNAFTAHHSQWQARYQKKAQCMLKKAWLGCIMKPQIMLVKTVMCCGCLWHGKWGICPVKILVTFFIVCTLLLSAWQVKGPLWFTFHTYVILFIYILVFFFPLTLWLAVMSFLELTQQCYFLFYLNR